MTCYNCYRESLYSLSIYCECDQLWGWQCVPISFSLFPGNSILICCILVKVAEMEAILQQHNNAMPLRDILVGLAERFRYD